MCVHHIQQSHVWASEDGLGWGGLSFPSTMWILRIKLTSSGLAAGIFTQWVISPALNYCFQSIIIDFSLPYYFSIIHNFVANILRCIFQLYVPTPSRITVSNNVKEPRAFHLLDKYSTTGLYFQYLIFFLRQSLALQPRLASTSCTSWSLHFLTVRIAGVPASGSILIFKW